MEQTPLDSKGVFDIERVNTLSLIVDEFCGVGVVFAKSTLLLSVSIKLLRVTEEALSVLMVGLRFLQIVLLQHQYQQQSTILVSVGSQQRTIFGEGNFRFCSADSNIKRKIRLEELVFLPFLAHIESRNMIRFDGS
jgi:hypothetical protein